MIIRRENNLEKMNKSFKYFSSSYCDSLKQKQSNNYKKISYKFTSLRFLSGVNASIKFSNRSRGKVNILKWRFGQHALQPWKSTFLLRALNNFIYNYGSSVYWSSITCGLLHWTYSHIRSGATINKVNWVNIDSFIQKIRGSNPSLEIFHTFKN